MKTAETKVGLLVSLLVLVMEMAASSSVFAAWAVWSGRPIGRDAEVASPREA